ncbi:type II toxin-antitoxin system HicA family toxin [Candidatus Uhrbacteria bacterium]|nr:type II toxin-antitoxin system HicA family toxin [Candidatus Uhrbacteria bacterium]
MDERLTPLPWEKLVDVFEREGFRIVRERGDHVVMTKSGIVRPLVIPRYRSVPVFIIRNNLRTARISREEFFRLLGIT